MNLGRRWRAAVGASASVYTPAIFAENEPTNAQLSRKVKQQALVWHPDKYFRFLLDDAYWYAHNHHEMPVLSSDAGYVGGDEGSTINVRVRVSGMPCMDSNELKSVLETGLPPVTPFDTVAAI
jgi:hypothetical protein